MVCAWYMDDSDDDQRLKHHRDPPEFLTLQQLFDISGVEYFKVDHENYLHDEILRELRESRGYCYEDKIVFSKECSPNYEEKLKNFFTEHLHTDEEIRLVLAGSGYFDVRDKHDKWIRIEVIPGDLIIIPSGIYHRFTLDEKDSEVWDYSWALEWNFIEAKRYFVGEPVWLPYNRPADDMKCRQEYLDRLETGFANNSTQ